jgi:hypothetical protein
MQTKTLTTKPTQEVISAIQGLDLESVKIRLMDEELGEGWSRDYAESIETAYKTYLTMLAKHQDHAEDIMLAKDVDEFWHTHILQTMKYADDCEKVFGAFLHHNPHVGPRTAEDLRTRAEMAEKTRRIYAHEFGDAQDTAWSGSVANARNGAYSSAAIAPDTAAYSSAALHAGAAAYSSAAIRTRNAAYSSASISADVAAYSSAAIRDRNAAYSSSSAAIHAQNAAYSSAAIGADRAAYSSAAIRADKAAYSSALIHAQNAAYSSAAISTDKAAYSSAAVKTDSVPRLSTAAAA